MASAAAAAGNPGEIQERDMPPASSSRSSQSNSNVDRSAGCAEQKAGVDAGGGPVAEADDSIKVGKIRGVNGTVYEGELKDGLPHGKGIAKCGNGIYEGEMKDGKRHGRGACRFAKSGDVYDGEWKDNKLHGKGTFTWANGNVYNGEWVGGELHGKGTMTYALGDVYVGEFKDGNGHGKGKLTRKDGSVYEGGFLNGMKNGWGAMKWPSGNLYEGDWKDSKQHGRGTVKWKNGDVYEGKWEDGQKTRGTITWADGETWTGHFSRDDNATGTPPLSSGDARAVDFALDPPFEPPIERMLRSQKSLQRRLQNGTTAKTCEHCDADDYRYKLRMCSGCNLALYCSAACQKAASGSHQRICGIISQLPPKDADRLILEYDKDRMVDLDAGLRYATKYMDEMKHLAIDVVKMTRKDTAKLSAKRLSSLLRSKKGVLEFVFWRSGGNLVASISINGYDVWKELHGLNQLWLQCMKFDEVRPICDIIGQQKNTLLVLGLPYLRIEWQKAKCRRAFAQAVNSCKHLVKLNLRQCSLMDSDLKVMLQDLPNLRIFNLSRHEDESHGLTDNTCGLIARKCPGLQELNLDNHNHLSVRGIRKIFEGCVHLRSFHTTTRKLTSMDVQSLLNIAPQLLHLSLGDKTHISEDELSQIIEATGGRTVLELSENGILGPHDGVSAKTKETYESQTVALRNIGKRHADPKVANEWAGMLEG